VWVCVGVCVYVCMYVFSVIQYDTQLTHKQYTDFDEEHAHVVTLHLETFSSTSKVYRG